MLILASKSPRRKELLSTIVPSFLVIPAEIDERLLDPFLSPKDLAMEESKLKAYKIFASHPKDEVLSCDTTVVLDNKALGKPNSEEEAWRMLSLEQGKKQIVLSAYTYISSDKQITRTVSTEVYFNPLSEKQIKEYVSLFKPFDKAGSYGIQDDYPLIKKIVGSFNNVKGLPTEDLIAHVFKR